MEEKDTALSVEEATASGSSLSPLTPRGRVAALVPSKSPSSSDNDGRGSLTVCNSDPDVADPIDVVKASELCLPLSEELRNLEYWEQPTAQGPPRNARSRDAALSVSLAGLASLYDTKALLDRSGQDEDPVWAHFSQNLAKGVYMGPHGMPSLASILEIQSSRDEASLSECLREFQVMLFPDGSPDQSLVPYERTLRQFTCAAPSASTQPSRPPLVGDEITEDTAPSDAPTGTLVHPNPQEMQRGGLDYVKGGAVRRSVGEEAVQEEDVSNGKEFRLLSMRDCGCPCSKRLRSLYRERSHPAAEPC